MLNLLEKSPRGIWLVGHRGAMGSAPENTMASFALGLEQGSDFLECDVHLAKDEAVVVMHDEAVERTTNGYGLIRDLTANEIKNLEAGSFYAKKFTGEKVPLLTELLEWAKTKTTALGKPLGLFIEIKNEPVRYLDIERFVIHSVKNAGMQSRVILIAFDHGVIKRAKKIAPEIAVGLLYDRPLEDPIERARQTHADALFPRRHMVTADLVKSAHAANLALCTWTVNEPEEMQKIKNCSVDAVATNYPDKAFTS